MTGTRLLALLCALGLGCVVNAPRSTHVTVEVNQSEPPRPEPPPVATRESEVPAPKTHAPDTERDTSNVSRTENVGYLVASTIPWSRVLIDGRDTGRVTPITPRHRIALAPGKHRVTFVVEGRQYSHTVTIRRGQTLRLVRQLE